MNTVLFIITQFLSQLIISPQYKTRIKRNLIELHTTK